VTTGDFFLGGGGEVRQMTPKFFFFLKIVFFCLIRLKMAKKKIWGEGGVKSV